MNKIIDTVILFFEVSKSVFGFSVFLIGEIYNDLRRIWIIGDDDYEE